MEENITLIEIKGKKFKEKFNTDLPDLDEGDVKLILVASEIDPKTEQIIEFLRYYGDIDINYILCKLYETERKEKFVISAQKIEFALPKEETEKRKRKRKPITYSELYSTFKDMGLNDLFEKLYGRLSEQAYPIFGVKSVSFKDNNRLSIFGIDLSRSSKEEGIYCWIYTKRFCSFYNIKAREIENKLQDMIDEKFGEGEDSGFYLYIKNTNQLDKFLKLLG